MPKAALDTAVKAEEHRGARGGKVMASPMELLCSSLISPPLKSSCGFESH